jgi:hypothetical protein
VNKQASRYVRLFGGNKIGNLIFWLPFILRETLDGTQMAGGFPDWRWPCVSGCGWLTPHTTTVSQWVGSQDLHLGTFNFTSCNLLPLVSPNHIVIGSNTLREKVLKSKCTTNGTDVPRWLVSLTAASQLPHCCYLKWKPRWWYIKNPFLKCETTHAQLQN